MKAMYVLLISSLFLCSCGSKHLSRGRAEELIVKKMSLPTVETTQLGKKFLKKSWSDPSWMPAACLVVGGQYSDFKKKLDDLQAKGLIVVGESKQHSGECNYLWATVTLTDNGKKYLVNDSGGAYQVKVDDLQFGEVTGVQVNEQFKVAEVDYTLKKANSTPFGSDESTSPTSRRASFVLFDDGWRIQ